MNNIVPQVVDTLRGMWQGRWAGLAVAWLTAVVGSVFIFQTPDKYEATARVYVDTQSVLKPLLSGLTVQPNVEQEVAILSRTLISRPNLQKLVRMTDLDLNVKTQEERERLIDGLSRQVYIKSAGTNQYSTNLYTIGFADPKPSQATRVVQSLLSIFVESGLTPKAKDAGQAQRFIEEQIKQYEQRLSEAEDRLKEFKLKNLDLSAPEGRDFFAQMADLSHSLQEARLLLEEAEKSRDTLKLQLANQEAPPSLLPGMGDTAVSISIPELDTRHAMLTKALDEMLLRFTDVHPDVINTRRILKEVQTQRDAERKRLAEEERKRAASSPQQLANTGQAQIKLAMAEAEAQVARLRARVREQEQRVAKLREAARFVPEREAQLAQLNRDYAIQKKNYDGLVARRESAAISGDAQAATGVADFRIIDPPQVAPNPVAPNRQMLIPAALLASLLAGLAASYFFSVARPTFHDRNGLKRFTQRPVLGAVTMIRTPTVIASARRRSLLFASGVGGLTATYGAVLIAVFFRNLLPF